MFALTRSTAVNIYVQLLPPPFGRVSLGIIIGSKILTAFQLIIHRALLRFKNTLNPFIGLPSPPFTGSPPRPFFISFPVKSVCNDTFKLVSFAFVISRHNTLPLNDELVLFTCGYIRLSFQRVPGLEPHRCSLHLIGYVCPLCFPN